MTKYIGLFFLFFLFAGITDIIAQRNPLKNLGGRLGGFGGGGGGGGDSLTKRTGLEDSITIHYRYLDSTQLYKLDSSVSDFQRRFPIPAHHLYLGNLGSATQSLTFDPYLKPGFDPGFHAFDVYEYKLELTKFYQTTRPYTELAYVIGSKSEQTISILHTQNITPNWNFALNYRLINAPGFFKNQSVNHNNYGFNSFFQSKQKRYSNYFIVQSNVLKASENGGIGTDLDYLNDYRFKDRQNIPVNLGGFNALGPNIFNSSINTGNHYSNSSFYMRQQYDWGKKDSIQVNDSTLIRLYYPKFRIQHAIRLNTYKYRYADAGASSSADFYKNMYQLVGLPDTLDIQDYWTDLSNELALIQFPDSKNQQQFLKVGGRLQNLTGKFRNHRLNTYNVILFGEYRNKTKNKKWDLEANGQLYALGFNSGDYKANARLRRFIGAKLGYFELGFENTNRTASFIFDKRSSFNFTGNANFNKENISHAFAKVEIPSLQLDLGGHLYLVGNYTYFSDVYTPAQHSPVFNVIKVTADKKVRVGRYWNWYVHATAQQVAGNAPINLPLIYTRHRFAFEGNFFTNLHLSTGLELRYNTPYKADGYSPMLGQFYFRDSTKINNFPEATAFFNFRIKTFTAYVRAENLNTATLQPNFGFTNNNMPIAGYAYPGLLIRVGIFWGFVN